MYSTTYMRNSRVVKFIRTESKRMAARGLGGGMEMLMFNGYEYEKFWRWMVGTVAQQCEYINATLEGLKWWGVSKVLSVKCLTLDFGSGHKMEPHVGPVLSGEPA